MSMKLRVTVLTLLAIAVILVASCAPPPVSISDRINMFVVDINTNPGNAYTECDRNATQYDNSKISSYWTSRFGVTPYVVTGINDSNTAAVAVTLGAAGTYIFGMVNDKNMGSDNWLISTINDPLGASLFN
jgi:hypothetical protein